jgi:hypothetical protein
MEGGIIVAVHVLHHECHATLDFHFAPCMKRIRQITQQLYAFAPVSIVRCDDTEQAACRLCRRLRTSRSNPERGPKRSCEPPTISRFGTVCMCLTGSNLRSIATTDNPVSSGSDLSESERVNFSYGTSGDGVGERSGHRLWSCIQALGNH